MPRAFCLVRGELLEPRLLSSNSVERDVVRLDELQALLGLGRELVVLVRELALRLGELALQARQLAAQRQLEVFAAAPAATTRSSVARRASSSDATWLTSRVDARVGPP